MVAEGELYTPEHSKNEHDASHTYPPAPSEEAKYNSGRTQQEWRELLDQDYREFYEGDVIRKNADGSKTYLRAYRYFLSVSEQDYDLQHAKQMIPLTVDAGLAFAIRPIRIPNAGVRGSNQEPVDELWLVFDEEEALTGLDNTQTGGVWQRKVEAEIAAIDQPLALSMSEMYGPKSNPREPIADLYALINDSPYADTLKEASPQGDTAPQTDSTRSNP